MAPPRTVRRLMSELNSFDPSTAAVGVVSIALFDEADLMHWKAQIKGPGSTAFAGLLFDLDISIPGTYPNSPPTMKFVGHKVYHPNVDLETGEICLDVLKDSWSPVWTIASALLAIQSLLATPEPDSPLNVDAANMVRCKDKVAFRSLVAYFYTMTYQ